jgi:hypothetical protein
MVSAFNPQEGHSFISFDIVCLIPLIYLVYATNYGLF